MNTPEQPDARKVADAALDVFVYAPVGLALEAKELLPKLAERGRNQVVLARLGARIAAQKAEAEAAKLKARLLPDDDGSSDPSSKLAASTATNEPRVSSEAATEPTAPAPVAKKSAAKKAAATKASSKTPAAKKATRSTVVAASSADDHATDASKTEPADALPINGYDTLSASQVVPRLDALRPRELEAVRKHEAANRGRRTILSRIAQLQS